MNMNEISKLIEEIKEGKLLSQSVFKDLRPDEILDKRDSDPFDSKWVNCFKEIEKRLRNFPLTEEIENEIHELREISFKVTSEATKQHEISSYVSDDFELISKAIYLRLNNNFANEMLESYRENNVPS